MRLLLQPKENFLLRSSKASVLWINFTFYRYHIVTTALQIHPTQEPHFGNLCGLGWIKLTQGLEFSCVCLESDSNDQPRVARSMVSANQR